LNQCVSSLGLKRHLDIIGPMAGKSRLADLDALRSEWQQRSQVDGEICRTFQLDIFAAVESIKQQ